METEKILEALDTVLALNSEVIMSNLSEKTVSADMITKGKAACELLKNAGLYEFDTDCSISELLTQIEKFVQAGLEE